MAVISFIYLVLPSRYHLKPDWQDSAFLVMMTSAFIAVAFRSNFWRNFTFWMSLVMSSVIHLVVIHAWKQRVPNRGEARVAVILGFVLFLAVYGLVRLVQRMFRGEEDQRTHSGDGHVVG